MMALYFKLFTVTNKVSNYFYNKYCCSLRGKQLKEKIRVTK